MEIYIYTASVLFEREIVANGYSYLMIYGKHINGYFCAIPNFGISCELSNPRDVFYNFERLTAAGIDKKSAKLLAGEIKNTVFAINNGEAEIDDFNINKLIEMLDKEEKRSPEGLQK